MTALTDLNQAARAELAALRPVHLVEVNLGAMTLYWATRDFVYRTGTQRRHYESYLLDISGVGESADFGRAVNPRITLTLADEPYGNHPRLSRLNETIGFLRAGVAVYETLLVDDAEVFADLEAGRTLKWKGIVERVYDLDTRARTFKLDCCSRLYGLRHRIGLSRVDPSLYPKADKTAVGQWRNHPIGNIEYVPCKLVKTGAVDLLFAPMTAGPLTAFAVSGASSVPWESSGTLQIDAEQFTYTAYNPATRTFTGVQRARNGTAAAAHNQGAAVFQVVSEFVYEASSVPVDAISAVTVDSVRQTLGAQCQVYTGRPGSRLAGFGSAAVVRFTVRPRVEKQINAEVAVTQEHDHATATGSHAHAVTGTSTVLREGISEYVSGRVISPEAWRDGSSTTASNLISDASNPGDARLSCNLNNSTNLGAISAVRVVVDLSVSVAASNSPQDSFTIEYGSYVVKQWSGSTGGASVSRTTLTWTLPPQAGWVGAIHFTAESGSAYGYASAYIHSAHVEIVYTPTMQASPATGVATSRSGATVVSGSSLAEAVIGREVCVEIRGVRDEPENTGLPAGAITGVPGAVIRRPDHVIKYVLCGLMGVPLSDIGASFAESGAWYETHGYRLDFLVHDIAVDGQLLLRELASQCRSICTEWGGKFELKVVPVFDPGVYDFVIEPGDVTSGPVFAYDPLADVSNRVMVLYRKDYRTYKESGAAVQGPIQAEAADAGFLDYLEGGWGARDLDETVRLTAVRESAAAQDWLDWRLLARKLPSMTVSMECLWRETVVQPGMVCRYDDPVMGPGAYLVTHYERNEKEATIRIEGRRLPTWTAVDGTAHALADTPTLVQTHILVARKALAQATADNVASLSVLHAQDASALAEVRSGNLSQHHALAAAVCFAASLADHAPLGLAWELDAPEDLQPTAWTGVIGWWEDDAPDLMPRDTLSGADGLWQTDPSGDLMPAA